MISASVYKSEYISNHNDSKYSLDIAGGHLYYFIITTLASIFLFYLLCGLVNSSNPKSSLFQSIILGGIPVYLYSFLLLNDKKWSNIILFIYFLKCGIGVWHYLTFLDPTYFTNPSIVHISAVNDFISMFEQVSIFAHQCWANGVPFEKVAYINHAELYWLIAGVFNKIGVYILSIVVVNGVSSVMIAIMISYITKLRNGNYGLALILSGLFPLSLITSYFYRDIVGLLIVTILTTCILLAHKRRWIWLILASFAFYLQRTVYCVYPILGYGIYLFLKNRGKNSTKNVLLIGLSIPIVCVASLYSSALLEGNEGYTAVWSNIFMYILFPIRYFMCIIGPFPWTQTFVSPEKTYYLQDYFMSAALFYLTLRCFPKLYNDYKRKKPIDYLVILGLLFMLAGIFNTASHMSYIAFGFCFFIPYMSTYVFVKNDFIEFNLKYFLYMAIFNIIYVAIGLGGMSGIFKG
ncbi:MAG: hypothetical protein NC453_11195 [Muribaculum sp.]|nr:hypothetical protein [Muribaculum sp.]